MTDSRTFVIRDDAARARAVAMVAKLPADRARPLYDVRIEPHRERHSAEQRSLLFALCRDLARQLPFPGGGSANPTAWKDFLVALYRGEKMVREGAVVVVVGGSVSQTTRKELSDILEFVQAYGATRGVRFSAPAHYNGGGL